MMMSRQSLSEKVAKTKNIMKKVGFENDQCQIHEVESGVDLAQGITEEEKGVGQNPGIDLRV